MNCPCCNREMKSGYIHNGNQPVQWIPDGSKPSAFSFGTTDEGVTLNNQFQPFKVNGYRAEAYYCESCKIVVAPVKK